MISLLRITADNHRTYVEKILEIEALSFSSPWPAAGFIQEIGNPIASFWAAEADGEIVGFICYWVLEFEIHLLNFAVHPEWRRKGTGRLLLGHMIKEAVSKGLEALWLEVRASNKGALKLYQELGFEQAGVRRNYYDDTQEDALIMRLSFSGVLSFFKHHAYGGRS